MLDHPDHHSRGSARRTVRLPGRRSGWALFCLALLPIGSLQGAAAWPVDSGTPSTVASGEEAGGGPGRSLRVAEAHLAEGRYDEAVAAFEGLRASWPDDARVLHGLARALTAMRRYQAADDVYRDMEDRRIEPIQAHLQRAHLWVERGDLQQAERAYRNVMQAASDNLEARIGLARVKHLQGLNRPAREQADNIVFDHPESEAARALLRDIDLELRPAVDVDPVRFDDGNGGWVDSVGAAYTFMAEPQTAIRIGVEGREARFRCADPALCNELAGPGKVGEWLAVDAWTLTAGLTSRLIAALDFHARIGVVRQETLLDDHRTVLIGGGIIRWHVGPRFTIVASGERKAMMDTAELIARGIRLDTADLLFDFRFHPAWLLSGQAEFGSYSDDNARQTAHAGIRWSPALQGIEFSGAFDAWYRRFRDDRDSGYFDPIRYDSERLTIEASGASPQESFYWQFHGMIGRHDFDTGTTSRLMAEDSNTVRSVRTTAGVRFGSRGHLEAFWSASNDPLAYDIAFDSRRYGLSWRLRL